ncbi:MAG TPA: Spy/CpxP family protein refolding chaperone [Spirochaetota bacterium]|nr:Spy/CpxP family protein refolding chaperone [Spirochaetota bacterium]
MKILKIAVLFLFVAVSSSIVLAQDRPSKSGLSRRSSGSRIECMREELDLTDAQAEQIEAIKKRFFEEREKFRGDREKMRELADAHRLEIYALLSEEQREKFDKMGRRGFRFRKKDGR